ncbi:hypothetical protein V1511DRAFT_454516 [Dipodascopsis uninucleata]
MSLVAGSLPTGHPPLKRSDSLDLLSPTQSLTGSVSHQYDSSALSSDDETDYQPISLRISGSSTMQSGKGSNGSISRNNSLNSRSGSTPFSGGSPFNRSTVNRSEYRYLHARLDDDFEDHGEDNEYDGADSTSLISDGLPESAMSTKVRYVYAFFALLIALIAFVIQTEAMGYVAQTLRYQKPMFMLYITHSAWIILYPSQIFIRWLFSPGKSLSYIIQKNVRIVKLTLEMITIQNNSKRSLGVYLLRAVFICTSALTIASTTWYIALDLTTPSDVTAIYNCSAFFAYAFSVPLLSEKLKLTKAMSVILATIGVFIVAYGDNFFPVTVGNGEPAPENPDGSPNELPANRLTGNVIIGIGALLYGLYEVLYKKLACPPSNVSVRQSVVFANFFGSCMGLCNLTVVWICLPVLHILGFEVFEAPLGPAFFAVLISVLSNAAYSSSFLLVMSLTSPVWASVASLLTIFLVAICDWFFFGTPLTLGAIAGGSLIALAFTVLAYAGWQDAVEDENHFITDEEIAAAESRRMRATIIEDAATSHA